MKIQEKSGSDEKRILTAMIVHGRVLGAVSDRWTKEGLFKSPWCNIVGNWCVKHYHKYKKAPKRGIEAIYDSWAENGSKDKDTVKLIDRFLEGLSDDYTAARKQMNPDYIIDLAGNYFNKVSLERTAQSILDNIEAGDLTKADKIAHSHGRVELGENSVISVFQDKHAITRAFEAKRESLIKYPGDLGKFFGESLERDGFIAFMGPQKRGKSWWLLDIAYRAAIQRRRVLYIASGDLSEHQVMWRFMCRAARRPRKPMTLQIPTSIEDGVPEFDEKVFKNGLTVKQARKAFARIQDEWIKSDDAYLKMIVKPARTLSVMGIENEIQRLERDKWIPDVVVVDYADILAPLPGFQDARDKVNETWIRLRTISQQYHCLVVTATQANAQSYRAELLGMWNFSEDNRKLSHVTGLIGINQTVEEKENQVMRLNYVVLREDDFTIQRTVTTAGCLSISNPAIVSVLSHTRQNKKQKED